MKKESAFCILLLNKFLIVTLSAYLDHMSRDSSVCIALGYKLGDRGSWVRFPAGTANFSLHTAPRTALGPTQPPIQWVPGSPWLKRPKREADHSPHLVPRSKNEWGYNSSPPIRLYGLVLS
jgi:hypothetical protein